MHCLASCDRPTVTCHLPREINCPNPLNFLHGQDRVVGASRGDALEDAASHIPLGTSAKMKRNGRTNAGRREVAPTTVGSSERERETLRAETESPEASRRLIFTVFPTLYSYPSSERWQPVASFSVRVTIGVAPALLADSVSPQPPPPVSLFTTWSLLSAVGSGGASERAAYNPQSSFLASELTSHTRRRRPTPSAAHDSLTHEAEEARLPVWQLGPLQDGEHLPPRDARLGRRRTGRLRATQAERERGKRPGGTGRV